MARYPLYVHHEVDEWIGQNQILSRRADWLLAELAARGVAGRPKGVVGPAREVVGLEGSRWRRSGLGGFDYYAWWFEAGESTPFPPASRVVRAIRQHDVMDRLTIGDPAEYRERGFEALDPLTDEQAAVVKASARIRLAVGHPGTGKTGALLYTVVEELRRNRSGRLLYVTLSRGLAEDARQFLDGLPELDERVEVVTYDDLLAEWSAHDAEAAGGPITDRAEETAFLNFLAELPPNELTPWQRARGALWAEVRAHLIGRALPFAFASRDQPASEHPFLDRESYRRQREKDLGVLPTNTAWKLARRFVETQQRPTLHRAAWDVLQRVAAGRIDGRLRQFDGLVVDEIQDLTLLQLAVLVEATRRVALGRGEGGGAAPCFIAAGDESQVVHPSGFDWGVYKDLLRERLATDAREFQLDTNLRSPSPLVETANRTAALYDELPRDYRPQAKVEANKTDAANGRVYLTRATPDDSNLETWLEMLRESPYSALVVCPQVKPTELAPSLAEERFADLLYDPAVVKGLDRQYVVVWEASRVLQGLREEIRLAKTRGDRPRYLAARRTIDEFRVAVSRSNETLVFLDRAEAERDPLLQDLQENGPAEEATLAHLVDVLEARGYDPLERTLEFLREAGDLLEVDLERALRTLERADAALSHVLDADSRRQALEQRIETRRSAANHLLTLAEQVAGDGPEVRKQAAERYAQAADQFAEVQQAYAELKQNARAKQLEVVAERYREAPPGSDTLAAKLPGFLEQYVVALGESPKRELRASAFRIARGWRDEVAGLDWKRPTPLRQTVTAAEHLAELTEAEQDRQAARALRRRLAEVLIGQNNWLEASATLSQMAEPPPAQLARCYEGLGRWDRAAELREQAGELEAALAAYRQAGDLARAAALAGRLDQLDLAASLQAAADLAAQLEALDELHTPNLTEPELRRLADSLRRAADKLTPRHGRAAERRR